MSNHDSAGAANHTRFYIDGDWVTAESPSVLTVNSESVLSTRPEGMSTFSRRSAASTSDTVSWCAVSRLLSIHTRIA